MPAASPLAYLKPRFFKSVEMSGQTLLTWAGSSQGFFWGPGRHTKETWRAFQQPWLCLWSPGLFSRERAQGGDAGILTLQLGRARPAPVGPFDRKSCQQGSPHNPSYGWNLHPSLPQNSRKIHAWRSFVFLYLLAFFNPFFFGGGGDGGQSEIHLI